MTDKLENPPAFPQLCYEAGERDAHGDLIEPFTTSKGGMTLRDYFAGQALSALLASPDAGRNLAKAGVEGVEIPAHIAKLAYAYATAMLEARLK